MSKPEFKFVVVVQRRFEEPYLIGCYDALDSLSTYHRQCEIAHPGDVITRCCVMDQFDTRDLTKRRVSESVDQ